MARVIDNFDALPCGKCGYDLRATAMHADCPECGTPVRYTRAGFRVEGDCLVVYANARLPARCFRTNMTGAECEREGFLGTAIPVLIHPWAQRVYLPVRSIAGRVAEFGVPLVIVVGLPLAMGTFRPIYMWLILALFIVVGIITGIVQWIVCKRVRLNVFANFVGQLREFAWYVATLLACIATFMLTGGVLTWLRVWQIPFSTYGILAIMLGVPVSVVLFVLIRRPTLYAVKYRDGEFWIKGCCPAYLRTCEIERQRILDEAMARNESTPMANASTPK